MVKEEQRGVEITTFKEVKDPSDPLNINPTKSFEHLAIDDPKDIEMSDQDETDNSTSKNQAEAMAAPTTKANSGSNTSHLASPLPQFETSAAVTNMKEKEKTVQQPQEVEIEDTVEEVETKAEVEKGERIRR